MTQWMTERRGLELPSLGFGCGGVWGMPWFNQAQALELLQAAVSLGVTHLDTGPTYCGGEAESRLGRFLPQMPRAVSVSTKVGTHLDRHGRLYKDYSEGALLRSLEQSLTRLGRPSVDLVLLHGPLDPALLTPELYASLERLLKLNLTRLIGDSCDGDVARKLVQDGVVDVLMTTFNDLRPAATTIRAAAACSMHVMAKSPMGSVAVRFPKRPLLSRSSLWYNSRMLVRRPTDVMRATRGKRSSGSAPSGLDFVLAEPAVSCAMVGTTSLDHLRANVQNARTVRH